MIFLFMVQLSEKEGLEEVEGPIKEPAVAAR